MKVNKRVFSIAGKVASSFTNSFKTANKTVDEHMGELQKLQGQLGRFKDLKSSTHSLTKEYTKQHQEVKKLAKEVKNAANPSKELIDNFEKAKEKASELKNQMDSNRESLHKMRTSLRNSGISTKNLRTESMKLSGQLAKQHAKQKMLEKVGSTAIKAKAIGSKMTNLGLKIMIPIEFATTDEEAFSEVKKSLGLSSEEANKFRKSLIKATEKIPMMNEAVYEIAEGAGRAGIPLKELNSFTNDAIKMSIAFGMAAGDVGNTMSDWRKTFQMNQEQVMKLGDQISYLGDKTKVAPGELSKVVSKVGRVGQSAGLSAVKVAALSASVIAQGKDSKVAVKGLNSLFSTLTAGEGATNVQKRAFEKLGLTSAETANAMQSNAEDAIKVVLSSIGKLNNTEQKDVLSSLFGDGAKGIASLTNNLDMVSAMFEGVSDSSKYAGGVLAKYAEETDNPRVKMELMKKSIKNAATSIGYALLPMVNVITSITNKWAGKIVNLTNKLSGFIREHPKVAKAIAYTVGAFAGLNLIIGAGMILFGNIVTTGLKIYDNWGKIAPVIGILKNSFIVFGGVLKSIGMFFMANPWILLITALAIGAVLVYKNWDKVKTFFIELGGKIKSIFIGLQAKLANVSNESLTLISAFLPFIGLPVLVIKNWSKISVFFSNLGLNIKNIFLSIPEILGAVGDWIGEKFSAIYEYISSIFSFDFIFEKLGKVGEWLSKFGIGNGNEESFTASNTLNKSTSLNSESIVKNSGKLNKITGDNITLSYKPEIIIQGNANKEILDRALTNGNDDLLKRLEAINKNNKRVAFE